jgi:hypothetical protein
MHGILIALHEACTGCSEKSPLNEIDGVLIAAFGGMSFSLYRVAHHIMRTWPRSGTELAVRRPGNLASGESPGAILELGLGILYTPFLFIRSFLRPGSTIRRRTAAAHLE